MYTLSIGSSILFRRSPNFQRFPKCWKIFENYRKSRMAQSRRHERPRRSRSQHSNPGGARCLSSASVAEMLAAASIKAMDALFGFPARNDAEWTKRELLGRSWRRDIGACTNFDPKTLFFGSSPKCSKIFDLRKLSKIVHGPISTP